MRVMRMLLSSLLTALVIMNVMAKSVCLEVEHLPEDTPKEAKIFVSGNFNNWQIRQYQLKPDDGNYKICFDTDVDSLQFKFHRGTWSTVEGTGVGGQREDRKLVLKGDKNYTFHFSIQGWEDIRPDKYVKIFVVDLSGTTPAGEDLFVSGNFSNWYPDKLEFKLDHIVGNKYLAEIPVFHDTVFYKYTRGTWLKVEGNSVGEHSMNRFLRLNDTGEYYDTIRSWEDLTPAKRYDIFIESVPKGTPHDATLFLSGNFNGWATEDTTYRFQKKGGNYHLSFFSLLDTVEFKVNRGNWQSVEGSQNGLAVNNRRIIHSKSQFPIRIKIDSWEDINVKWFNLYTMALIVPVFIGLLLLMALNGLKHQQLANRYLQLLLVFLCVFLVFRVITYYREVFNWYPQLIVISDAIYFLFGPTLFLYVRALLNEEKLNVNSMKHFVPFLIMVVLYIPFLTIEKETFILGILSREYRWVFALAGFAGLLLNFYYWLACLRLNKAYESRINDNLSYDVKDNYLQYVLSLGAVLLFFWLMIYLNEMVGYFLSISVVKVSNLLADICWFLLSMFIYVFGFFAIQKPEIFKVTAKKQSIAPKGKDVVEEEVSALKEELTNLMHDKKLYLETELSLNDLAVSTGASVHHISRVINEGMHMNFYDYINSLRIEEFIRRVNAGESEHKTFLAIAYEVGFSSKSTFNRSFKKFEHLTPREYFKKIDDQRVTNH